MTTIKVPKVVRDRLAQIAASQETTLAQTISHLIDQFGMRPRPKIGGYRSCRPFSAEEIDRELGNGFGAL